MATNGTNATCMKPMAATSNGVWQHNNPIDFSFPLLVIQIILVLVTTRTLAFLFKPLRQPRVIGEIIVSQSSVLQICTHAFIWTRFPLYYQPWRTDFFSDSLL
jgi:hypothetical protein